LPFVVDFMAVRLIEEGFIGSVARRGGDVTDSALNSSVNRRRLGGTTASTFTDFFFDIGWLLVSRPD
jgi:hypothetical protein